MQAKRDPSRVSLAEVARAVEAGFDGADPARAGALGRLRQLRATKATRLERERKRLAALPGSAQRVAALAARLEANRALIRALAVEEAVASTEPPDPGPDEWVVHGRVYGKDMAPRPDVTVAVHDARGNWVERLGRARTDAGGYFKLSAKLPQTPARDRRDEAAAPNVKKERAGGPDASRGEPGAAAAAAETLFLHVTDDKSKLVHVDKRPLVPRGGGAEYVPVLLAERPAAPAGGGHDAPAAKAAPRRKSRS